MSTIQSQMCRLSRPHPLTRKQTRGRRSVQFALDSRRSAATSHPGGHPMAPFTLMIDSAPRDEDVRLLLEGLNGHAIAQAGTQPPQPLAIFLYDETERIVGGLQ